MGQPDLFDDPRLTAMGLFYEAYDGLVAKMEPTWKAHGVSGLDMNALLRLSRSPGRRLRMTDLATQTSLSTSGVTRLVDRLSAGGLVERVLDPTDRRSAHAVLTDAGARRLEQVLPDYLDTIQRWFTGLLTPDQLDALTTALRIIRDATNPAATARTD
ncbi:DNA-binding transcriptional regulator, MarR family [Nocardia amikacinitolerans]|uniref:DNA-binding transcriptional regulator, MarR family n=1 Tax=Nocardia amikacinitolerans TaxID=756689 RepID=A0A285L9E8_9NOCA|nr:MarR family transcriptional regulator [Nocardia amikacinitolerans]MCP2275308.1 DNA-binding transcriptional regulator, MarR family [Nocardia amikacinitolerans]MCP2295956.1 DNA-binding transcriptional regulator, MarR family [Nocardia amikacinitolerans]SNY81093.1 DNA-binding transcriptional regulator, MarR family [Nocardia amikacinitolerans]